MQHNEQVPPNWQNVTSREFLVAFFSDTKGGRGTFEDGAYGIDFVVLPS
jgi:hypothetical protein